VQPRPETGRLASAITVRSHGGVLNVSVGLPGRATVSLYGLNGALKAELGGAGTFNLDTRSLGHGLHVLRVRHGGTVHSRTLML
jgi:hypothetical protein